MRVPLLIHPDCPPSPAARIHVDVERTRSGGLSLSYYLSGTIAALRLAEWRAPAGDPLWEHSCFEAFVGAAGASGYLEMNFAPSTRWAAYRFDDYRQGMAPATGVDASLIDVSASDSRFELSASLELDAMPDGLPWRLGLAAVVEDCDRNKSYWALAHPPGKPDFHHRDCFALELPAAATP